MQTVALEDARLNLLELINAAAGGEDVFIRKDDRLSVQLVPRPIVRRKRHFGSAKGLITKAPDFDEPLDDLKECME